MNLTLNSSRKRRLWNVIQTLKSTLRIPKQVVSYRILKSPLDSFFRSWPPKRPRRAMVWYQKWGRGTSPAEVTIEVQDRNCKADGGSQEKEREGESEKEMRGRKSGCLARRCDLYPDIPRNSGKRYFNDFQTRSMEDPRWPSLPLLSTCYISAAVVTLTLSAERIYILFLSPVIDDIKHFKYHPFAIKCQLSRNLEEINLNIVVHCACISDKKILSFKNVRITA